MKSSHRLAFAALCLIAIGILMPESWNTKISPIAESATSLPKHQPLSSPVVRPDLTVPAPNGSPAEVVSGNLPVDLEEGGASSIAEQIRAARRWFAQSPREGRSDALVATVDGPRGFSLAAGAEEVEVLPRSAVPWSWKMKPANATAAIPRAAKERISYDRGGAVEEWFVNVDGGIEHGFTLSKADEHSVRKVTTVVETSLNPMLRPGRDGVDFVDQSGAVQLHYDGLYAYDASGRELEAWMEIEAGEGSHGLTLAVNTSHASFPVTIDPVIALAAAVVQPAIVQATDGFATSMDTHGDFLVAGAPLRIVGEHPDAGAVFVFKRTADCPPAWMQLSMVTAPGNLPSPIVVRSFGRKVALGGTTLAVTSIREGSAQGPVNEVRVFSLDAAGLPTAMAALQVGQTLAGFQHSVDVTDDGNMVIVGTAGVGVPNPGSVVIYGRNAGGADNWGIVQTLVPAGGAAEAEFGREVSTSGNLLAVSAPGMSGGRVFTYVWNGVQWEEDETFLPPAAPPGQTVQGFAKSISLHGNWLAIGAPESDGERSNNGRVIIAQRRALVDQTFQTTSYIWFVDSLFPPGNAEDPSLQLDPKPNGAFGSIVNMAEGRLVIGEATTEGQRVSIYDERAGSGINLAKFWSLEKQITPRSLSLGGISSVLMRSDALVVADAASGKIVEERRTLTQWPATQKLSEGPASAKMGWVVARDGDLLAVSAPGANAVHVFRKNNAAPPNNQWTLAWTTQDVAGYGLSIALKDDILLIGSPEFSTGSVIVFRRTNAAATTWSSPQILLPPANFPAERFGASLAFNGTFVVVGDPLSNAGSGGTVVFERPVSGLWPIVMASTASPPSLGYGAAVAITEANDFIVGAPQTPVPFDLPVADGGAAFVWKYQPVGASPVSEVWEPAWSLDQKLSPTGSLAERSGGLFGTSVELRGQHAFVGAPGDGTPDQPGVVYVFRRDTPPPAAALPPPAEVPWRLLEKLSPSGPGAEEARCFGQSVAATAGNSLAVGAPGSLLKRGQVFVFAAPGLLRFSPMARFLNPCGGPGDGFGQSVILSPDEAVVGSPGHGAFVFEKQRSQWRLTREVPPASNVMDGDLAVGSDIAIDGDWMAIGAPRFTTEPLPPRAPDGPPTPIIENPVPEQGRVFFVLHRHANPVADQFAWQITSTIGMPGFLRAFPRPHNDDEFRHGGSIAISGRNIVVGTPAYGWFAGEDTPGGRAYVFELNAEGQLATVYPSTSGFKYAIESLTRPADAIEFGHDVAISGEWIAVSAAETLVNGGTQIGIAGTVALYRKRGWYEKIIAANPSVITELAQWQREKTFVVEELGYGCAVALDGGRLAVGAYGAAGPVGGSVGGVFLYEQHHGGTDNWGEVKFISDPFYFGNPDEPGHALGADVALEADTLVVGYGGRFDDFQFPTFSTGGRALVLERHVGGLNNWGPVAMLQGAKDSIGVRVAISGGLIAVGGPGNMLMDESSGEAYDVPGAVSLFHRQEANNMTIPELPPGGILLGGGSPPDLASFKGWGKVASFHPPSSNRAHTWNYGAAVALDRTTLAVGAPGEVTWHTEDSNDADFLADSVEIDSMTPGRAFIYELKGSATQTAIDRQYPDLLTEPAGGIPYSGTGNIEILDFDHDGIDNVMEAFHGLNPLSPDSAEAAFSTFVDATTGELVMRWREGIDTGLTGMPQWSRNISQWHNDGTGPAAEDVKTFTLATVMTHPDHVIKEARLPAAGENRIFARLNVIDP